MSYFLLLPYNVADYGSNNVLLGWTQRCSLWWGGISHNITCGYHALLLRGSHAPGSEDFIFNWNVNYIKLTKLLFFRKKVIIFSFVTTKRQRNYNNLPILLSWFHFDILSSSCGNRKSLCNWYMDLMLENIWGIISCGNMLWARFSWSTRKWKICYKKKRIIGLEMIYLWFDVS